MRAWRILYWGVAGALIGFGVIGILSIGAPFLLVGLGMIVFGAIRLGAQGLWALLVGLGGLPMAILIWDLATAPPPCPAGPIILPPGVHQYTCSGPLDNYRTLAVAFGVIALAGLAWPLLQWVSGRRR